MLKDIDRDGFPVLLELQKACIRELTDVYTDDEIQAWIQYLDTEGSYRYGNYQNKVFVDNDTIVGFVSWSSNDEERLMTIECLYVLKDYRKKGIGRQLLQEAEWHVVPGDTIHVRSTVSARSFYEANGYIVMAHARSRAGFLVVVLDKRLA